MVPSETTNAALAACIGVSERRVATVKAEGRLPLTTGGRIDLAELVRRGWTATLAAKGQPVAFPEATAEERAELRCLAPALDFTDLHDRGFAAATLLALHEAPICATLALGDAGVPRTQAERAGDLLVVLLWDALNRHARACGLPDSGTDGPVYAATNMLAWREAVNWPRLFDGEGRSVVTARMAENVSAEAGA